jgi:hypothetical protein
MALLFRDFLALYEGKELRKTSLMVAYLLRRLAATSAPR